MASYLHELIPCLINATASQKGILNCHIESVHNGKKQFQCNACNKAFSYKHTPNRHIESVHEGKKPFSCNICDKAFSYKHTLNGHIEAVHSGNSNVMFVTMLFLINIP